jgi:hypothetical protein
MPDIVQAAQRLPNVGFGPHMASCCPASPSRLNDMSRKLRNDDDPIARYREWAENRYNPGHWLGGNVPPGLRHLWSTNDRRA